MSRATIPRIKPVEASHSQLAAMAIESQGVEGNRLRDKGVSMRYISRSDRRFKDKQSKHCPIRLVAGRLRMSWFGEN